VRPQLLLNPRLHRIPQIQVLLPEDEVPAAGVVLGLDNGSGHGASFRDEIMRAAWKV
jgi:hypothetical protein